MKILIVVVAILAVIALFLGVLLMLRNRKDEPDAKGGWFAMKYLWYALLVAGVIVALLAVTWLWPSQSPSLESPSLKTVWEGTKNHWLWIVLILGLPFFLLFISKEPWAKALQWFLATVAVMLFIGIPLVHVIWGEKQPPTVACKPYSSAETRHCLVTESGVILASGESIRPGEFEFCYIKPEKAELQAQWTGPNVLQVRSMHGTFPLQYRMIRRDTLINGSCPAVLS